MDSRLGGVDEIILKGIQFEAVVGLDAWNRSATPQPVELELRLSPVNGLQVAAREDSVAYSIDIGKIYRSLRAAVFNGLFESITHLYQTIRENLPETTFWHIIISLPKCLLVAKSGIQVSWKLTGSEIDGGTYVLQVLQVSGIDCQCILGINSHERLQRQRLQVSVSAGGIETRLSPAVVAGVNLQPGETTVYLEMVKEIVERVEGSDYETLEALATAIAQIVTIGHGFDNARVQIEKPGGLAGFGASGVNITRTKAFFENKDFWKVKRP